MTVAELIASLRDISCLVWYFLALPGLILLLICRLQAFIQRDPTLRPSWITLVMAAFFAFAVYVPCHFDLTFQPTPARW